MTTIISNIFFKISYRDLHRKTAFHSRLFLGFPKDGINMIWNEKVLIKPLISKINILREFLLCPPPTLLLVRFKPWQQCWRWWQVPQIFVLPRDSTPLRYSSCVIVTVATMSWWWWWLQQQQPAFNIPVLHNFQNFKFFKNSKIQFSLFFQKIDFGWKWLRRRNYGARTGRSILKWPGFPPCAKSVRHENHQKLENAEKIAVVWSV